MNNTNARNLDRYTSRSEAVRDLSRILDDWQLLDVLQEEGMRDFSENSRAAFVDYELAKMALATILEADDNDGRERI